MPSIVLEVDPGLWFLLSPRRRRPRFTVEVPGTDTVGHVVRMVGIPPTEIGPPLLDGRPVDLGGRPTAGIAQGEVPVLLLVPRPRPQPTRCRPPRFLLDVHLRPLARRLRLLGIDAAWEPDAEDPHLVDRAARERRVLLTQDRGLLHRGALPESALVRGEHADDQLADVLDRFAPPLAPWTRCPRCGAPLEPAGAEEVAGRLMPRTRQAYTAFSRCTGCGHVYWRGAHAARLDAVVERAREVLDRRADPRRP
ncbi:Mut7-C RNAse domain-containing protein [Kocuria sp. M1R5S2]|uniref:Mut7-C RNAse domain-containing protein n=1 Tax=Kocuria rhizosphaerae TaxID=3376285 RepID=UPI0037AEEB59